MIVDTHLIYTLSAMSLLGISCGIVGSFLLVQRKSLLCDTLAHATLPGITGIFLLTQQKNSFWLLCGGTISALIAAWIIHYLHKHTTLQRDTILGTVLSTSFGLGTLLLSKIQTAQYAHQAGITKYLLGNAATLLYQDFIMIIIVTCIVIVSYIIYARAYSMLIFDSEFCTITTPYINAIALYMLIINTLTIIVGLQTLGIILVSSLLIAPAAAAYQWTKRFHIMIMIAIFFSIISTITGTCISIATPHMPTGPIITIVATLCVFLSFLLSPTGIIKNFLHKRKTIREINALHMLSNFLLFNEGLQDPFYAHDLKALSAIGKQGTNKLLRYLASQNLIESPQQGFWRLTPIGLRYLQQHREI